MHIRILAEYFYFFIVEKGKIAQDEQFFILQRYFILYSLIITILFLMAYARVSYIVTKDKIVCFKHILFATMLLQIISCICFKMRRHEDKGLSKVYFNCQV